MRVSDLMTTPVMTIPVNEPAAAAAQIMWESDCGAVPVVDGEGRAVGMITDRDICMSTVLQNRAPREIQVEEAMSQSLYACAPGDSLDAAEALMRMHQIRRLPVLDADRRPIGILSLADVFRATAVDDELRDEIPLESVTSTAADICTPRKPPAATLRPVL